MMLEYPCRLCGAAVPLSSASLYYVEYFGKKHLNKLMTQFAQQQQQQQKHPAVGTSSSSTSVGDQSLQANKKAALCDSAVAILKEKERRENSGGRGGSSVRVPPVEAIKRIYLLCGQCKTVFVPDPFLVTSEREVEEYSLHENDGSDEGYRVFLSRAVDVVVEHFEGKEENANGRNEDKDASVAGVQLTPMPMLLPLRGLDFGCGPGPTICNMLAERSAANLAKRRNTNNDASDGTYSYNENEAISSSPRPSRSCVLYTVVNYDKYFCHGGGSAIDVEAMVPSSHYHDGGGTTDGVDTSVGSAESLQPNRYNFITATEVVEHLAAAGFELKRLWDLLLAAPSTVSSSPPSILVIMTKRADIYDCGEVGVASMKEAEERDTDEASPSSAASPPARAISNAKFVNWHYKNDPTHITYFTGESFEWCRDVLFGGRSKCRLTIVGPDVVTFEKI